LIAYVKRWTGNSCIYTVKEAKRVLSLTSMEYATLITSIIDPDYSAV
jgi:hypothetical protein